MTEVVCDECKIGKLQARQYNYEEVIFLCNNKTCAWPLYPNVGQDLADFIVKRKSSEIDSEARLPKKRQKLDKSVENKNQPIVLEEDSLDQLLNGVNTLGQELDLSEIFGDSIACSDNNLDVDNALLDFSLFKEDFAIPDVDSPEIPAIGSVSCISVPTRDAETENSFASVSLHSQSNHQPQLQPTPDDTSKSTPNLAPLSTPIPIHPKKAKKASRARAKPARIAAVKGGVEPKNGNSSTSGTIQELDVFDIPFDERGSIDACLCLLVHSHHVLQFKASFVRKLVSYYTTRIVDPNFQGSKYDAMWTAIKRECSDILNKRKTSLWKQGQRLPSCVLSEFVKTPATLNKIFNCDVRSEISCTNCGKKIVSIDAKTVHIMEKVPENFTITRACCFTQCSICGADNQKKLLTYYMLPDVLAVQFSSGLPDRNITSFDFVYQGNLYKVTEVVQHEAKTDRFTAWTRNYNDDSWVRHNNFHDEPVKHGTATLNVPPSERHLLIWEKCDPSKLQETSLPLRTAASNSRKITSVSMPSSPCKFLPSPVMPAKAKLKTAQEKHVSIPKSTLGVRTYSPPKRYTFLDSALSKTNVFGSEISRHSDELDDLLPSPSNSETSNASDGDVTVANSSFFASLRNNRDSTPKPLAGYPWVAESLAAHQRQWTEFKCRQPQKKRTVRKMMPEKRLPVVRKDPSQVQKLLAGTEIFLS